MAMRGLPRRRGRPPKVVSLSRIAIRTQQRRLASDNAIKQSEEIEIGEEMERWKDLKNEQDLDSDENVAKFLIDSWESKEAKKERNIPVGPATMHDFESFRSRTKRSADEIIRFFLRLDVEPGQNIIPVAEDTTKMFDSLKSSSNLGANELMQYLFSVQEKFSSKTPDEKKSMTTEKTISNIEISVRKAVREEMIQLINDGIFPLVSNSNSHHDDSFNESKYSPSKLDVSSVSNEQIVDSAKKRSRKSLPQRVVIDAESISDTDHDVNNPISLAAVSAATTEVIDDTEVMQYNYIMNNTSSPSSTPGPVPSPATPSQPKVATSLIIVPPKPTSVYSTPSAKDLEAQGIFKVAGFTISRDTESQLGCPYCEYKSTIVARLRRHVTLHTGKAYKCSMCDRSYTEEYKLKEHFQVKHERSVHFMCELCDRDFTSKGGLKYHTKTVHKKDFAYWCEQCSKGFNQLQFYQGHMNKHNGPAQYKCNVCHKEFSYLATLSMHRKNCLPIPGKTNALTCEMCGDTFTTSTDLGEHISTEHCDVTRFRCGCGSEYRWRNAFDTHKATCKSAFNENGSAESKADGLTNVAIINVESLYKKLSPKSLSFTEPEEKSESTNVNFDENSLDSVQIMNVESGEQFTCDLTTEEQPVPSGPGVVHACQQCNYKTPKLSHLKRHTLTHTGKKYKCHECPKSFNELNKLRTHQNSKHHGHALYKCDKCSRTFSSKGGIMYHQQTKHNNSFKYRCETCDKGFNTIQHYLGHKNTHSGIRPYVCDKCDLGFAYPSVLTSHKRVCKGKIEGVNMNGQLDLYPCHECKEKFAMLSSLEQHMLDAHGATATNRYMCDCGEDFELRALYDLHKTTCTKSDSNTDMILETVADDGEENNKIATDEIIVDDEEFKQLTPEKFNAILNNQPVFPS